jgi:hypothetical protein
MGLGARDCRALARGPDNRGVGPTGGAARINKLYDTWGQPEKAEGWRKKMGHQPEVPSKE